MISLSTEVIFYGGILIAGCSLLAMILHLCISQVQKVRLHSKLVQEYGEKQKK